LTFNTLTGATSGTPMALSVSQVYTVTGTNASGSASAMFTLSVVAQIPPTITQFSAVPNPIAAGSSSTLIATFSNGTGTIDNGIGAVTSGVGVSTGPLLAGRTYTLTVTNGVGSTATASTTVTVNSGVAIISFTATPSTITAGQTSILAPVFVNATSASVDNGLGAVVSGTTYAVIPAASTSYTLTANGVGGPVTQTVAVTVVPVPNTPTITAPAHVSAGSSGLLASVPVQPGCTYLWSISGGVITSGGATSSITFTAGPVGTLNLSCTVFNAAGTASTPGTASVIVDGLALAELTFDLPDMTNPGNTVPLTLKQIPSGTFIMGQTSVAEPIHTVTLSTFYMAKFETTQAQWLSLLGANPSHFTGDLSRPVEAVNWNDISQANGFLDKLNAATLATRPAGSVFRLPTEAEWEYACRGGTTTSFYWGDDPSLMGTYAWYSTSSGAMTHPVGLKTPNAFGLFDMSGNVWEWCQDYFGTYSSATQTDPQGPGSGTYRVQRGGSWYNYDFDGRSAVRYPADPSFRYPYVGFRVVLAAPANVAILRFTASPVTITLGQSSILSPVFVNASSASIDNGIGAVISGTSYTVTPAATTTYTLTANGLGGTVTQPLVVAVVPAPATPTLTVPAAATTGATGLLASVPAQAGCTYLWTISGGIITSGGTTPSITFNAGPVGNLNLSCTVTNAAGTASIPGTASVLVNDVAPGGLAYSVNPVTYAKKVPIASPD
jgi:formylglycine-generating enzyme required for sulfatase activity